MTARPLIGTTELHYLRQMSASPPSSARLLVSFDGSFGGSVARRASSLLLQEPVEAVDVLPRRAEIGGSRRRSAPAGADVDLGPTTSPFVTSPLTLARRQPAQACDRLPDCPAVGTQVGHHEEPRTVEQRDGAQQHDAQRHDHHTDV
jgi:hypothetical protein